MLDSSEAKLKCYQMELEYVVSPEKLAFQVVKLQFPFQNDMMKLIRYAALKEKEIFLINNDRGRFMHESN